MSRTEIVQKRERFHKNISRTVCVPDFSAVNADSQHALVKLKDNGYGKADFCFGINRLAEAVIYGDAVVRFFVKRACLRNGIGLGRKGITLSVCRDVKAYNGRLTSPVI